MRPPNAGLTWSGKWHYFKDGQPAWALCGAAPYPEGDEPSHLKKALANGEEFPICKKCAKAKERQP